MAEDATETNENTRTRTDKDPTARSQLLQAYREDGFVGPVPVLSRQDAHELPDRRRHRFVQHRDLERNVT